MPTLARRRGHPGVRSGPGWADRPGPTPEVRGRTFTPRRATVGTVAAVLATVVAVWFVRDHTALPVRRGTGEIGSIVYAARDGSGQTRLYRWDLVADVVHRGPAVSDPIGLFDASGAHPGWVGATSRSPGGGVDVGVFKFLGPEDQALPLGHGDIASWSPEGADTVVVSAQPSANGCVRILASQIHLAPLRRERTADQRTCASLVDVRSSVRVTYLSLQGPAGSRIVSLSIGRFRPVLGRYRLDGLSAANDMVVTPDPPGSVSGASFPPQGAALYFRGPARQSPTPFESAGTPLALERIAAWAPDGTEAIAIGTSANGRGFYRLPAAPPAGNVQPMTYIGPVEGTGLSAAIYTGVGTRIVYTGGRFFRAQDGASSPLPLPRGAPLPDGPMVWIQV